MDPKSSPTLHSSSVHLKLVPIELYAAHRGGCERAAIMVRLSRPKMLLARFLLQGAAPSLGKWVWDRHAACHNDLPGSPTGWVPMVSPIQHPCSTSWRPCDCVQITSIKNPMRDFGLDLAVKRDYHYVQSTHLSLVHTQGATPTLAQGSPRGNPRLPSRFVMSHTLQVYKYNSQGL